MKACLMESKLLIKDQEELDLEMQMEQLSEVQSKKKQIEFLYPNFEQILLNHILLTINNFEIKSNIMLLNFNMVLREPAFSSPNGSIVPIRPLHLRFN